jgi:hypothetical protein
VRDVFDLRASDNLAAPLLSCVEVTHSPGRVSMKNRFGARSDVNLICQ